MQRYILKRLGYAVIAPVVLAANLLGDWLRVKFDP